MFSPLGVALEIVGTEVGLTKGTLITRDIAIPTPRKTPLNFFENTNKKAIFKADETVY